MHLWQENNCDTADKLKVVVQLHKIHRQGAAREKNIQVVGLKSFYRYFDKLSRFSYVH